MNDTELSILESLYDSQGRNDALITLLVELCHLLSACLRREHDALEEGGGIAALRVPAGALRRLATGGPAIPTPN